MTSSVVVELKEIKQRIKIFGKTIVRDLIKIKIAEDQKSKYELKNKKLVKFKNSLKKECRELWITGKLSLFIFCLYMGDILVLLNRVKPESIADTNRQINLDYQLRGRYHISFSIFLYVTIMKINILIIVR